MMPPVHPRSLHPRSLHARLGRLLALVALLVQIAINPAAIAHAAAFIPLTSSSTDAPICGAGAHGNADDTPAPHPHHDLACTMCPACQAAAVAAIVPQPIGWTPAPPPTAGRRILPPPARGPPGPVLLAATYPTGPPSLA